MPISAGRDFTADDIDGGERVVIISQSVADQLFSGREVLNRRLLWTDSIIKFIGVSPEPRRIVGVVPDIDDERIVPGPALTVYHPFEQEVSGGRVFVHTRTDPYPLVPNITRIVRDLASDQPVEQAATLDDVRAEVLAPDRLNSLVFGIFAAVAVAISVVGVAGVLAFSVSGRMHEFGIRLAIGSKPSAILVGVLTKRCAHCGRWYRRRRYRRLRRRPSRRRISAAGADAGNRADRRRGDAAAGRSARRIGDPGGQGGTRRCDPRVADRMTRGHHMRSSAPAARWLTDRWVLRTHAS